MSVESASPSEASRVVMGDERLATACRALLWLGTLGASLALSLFLFGLGDALVPYVRDNELPRETRLALVAVMMLGALAGAAVMVVSSVLRMRAGHDDGLLFAERLGRRLGPLALSGLVPVLLRWPIWSGRDLSFLLLATAFSLASLALWRAALTGPPLFRVSWSGGFCSPLRRWLSLPAAPLAVVVAAALGYAVYFTYFALQNYYYNLHSSNFDLAVENNLMWNLVDGGPLFKTTPHRGGPAGSHLGYHHSYISFVLAPLYALLPRPTTLLTIQSTLIGAAAVPLFLLARLRLPRWTAAGLAIAYLFYAPVHGANLFNFHYQSLMPFFLWFTLYFAERGGKWTTLVFALLSISIREDVAACVALLGAYLVLTRRRPRLGLVIMVLGLAHFLVVKMVIMPEFLAGRSSFINQYKDLVPEGVQGFGGVLATAFGNPGYTVHTLAIEKQKLVYVLQILSPLVFLPLLRPIGWLLCLPGLFFSLLSTQYRWMIEISFQYSFFWTTFVFVAVISSLEALAEPRFPADVEAPSRRRAWMIAMGTAMLLTSYQHGAIFQRHTVRGGFAPAVFQPSSVDEQRRADLYRLIALIPKDARVCASDKIAPHVSSRESAYTLRMGVFDAEYLLFDSTPLRRERDKIRKILAEDEFGIVEIAGDFALARRGHDATRNQAFLQMIRDAGAAPATGAR